MYKKLNISLFHVKQSEIIVCCSMCKPHLIKMKNAKKGLSDLYLVATSNFKDRFKIWSTHENKKSDQVQIRPLKLKIVANMTSTILKVALFLPI